MSACHRDAWFSVQTHLPPIALTSAGMYLRDYYEAEDMVLEHQERRLLLVVEDVEETALLMKKMLDVTGYRVLWARDEAEAIAHARTQRPDLILMSLGSSAGQLVEVANRIREQAAIGDEIAVVLFCIPTIPEGAEIEVGKKIYFTRPRNFDQLRTMLHRLTRNGHPR